MSRHQPVVWHEGMLLAPQHLQQWDRYLHHLVDDRFRALRAFEWGFTELKLDRESLRNGRIALLAASGVLPDGTPFAIPDGDAPPSARAIEGHFDAKQDVLAVHLGLPAARPGRPQLGDGAASGLPRPRFSPHDEDLEDANSGGDPRRVTVARRNFAILFPDDALGDHDTLQVAEVVRDPGSGYVLRETFVPPCLSVAASEWLMQILRGLHNKLNSKSTRLTNERPSPGGVVNLAGMETADLLGLQLVNAAIPALAHVIEHGRAHPEDVYLQLVSLAAALCAFAPRPRATELPRYDHGAPFSTFGPLNETLTQLIELVGGQVKVTVIPLEKDERGRHIGRLQDPRLLEPSASFFLGVRAEVEEGTLIRDFPAKSKLASLNRLDALIAALAPGIGLQYLRVTPAGLPVKSNMVYFQLDPASSEWADVRKAQNLALFIAADYPSLSMELLGKRA
ncbi:MAG: type VI secretion system-associated protein [Candidatus Eisenbacteria bacterium RBG_16_71_46]|nr:MAG: type VI secretion system-associated protein [Candidatus Eisenbacteria bacterium RBG_16_71_46]